MTWVQKLRGLGTGTSDSPALAVFQGRLYAAWKGVPGDNSMWYSSFDGKTWSQEQQGLGHTTSAAPTLAVFQGRLYAAHKGETGPGYNDTRMWLSSFDGKTWSQEQQGLGTGTSDSPALAVFNNRLYAAWKGVPGDTRMWYSIFDGKTWSQEHHGVRIDTGAAPALAVFNHRLYAAWKNGVPPGENEMFFSSAPGKPFLALRAKQDPGGRFVEVDGRGFTSDGAVKLSYIITPASENGEVPANQTGNVEASADESGAFLKPIPLAAPSLHSAQVGATDLDSGETADASIGG
jgi:hypothetical protein